MCFHCIGLFVMGLLLALPFIGPTIAVWKDKLTRKLNKTCEDKKCDHHEDEEHSEVADQFGTCGECHERKMLCTHCNYCEDCCPWASFDQIGCGSHQDLKGSVTDDA